MKMRRKLPSDVITEQDLKISSRPLKMSDVAVHSGIARSIKNRELIKLKRGLYVFGKELRKKNVSKFEIANKMYGPSYISFESALSYHGMIPEAVYVTTSACSQSKKKKYSTPLGDYTFEYVPCDPFFTGVVRRDGNLVATPIRALFDYVYARKKEYTEFKELESDLRINEETLKKSIDKHNYANIEQLASMYKKKHVKQFFDLLMRHFK